MWYNILRTIPKSCYTTLKVKQTNYKIIARSGYQMNLTNDILRDAIPHQFYQCTMNPSCDFSCHNIPNPRYIQTESDLGSTSIC